ncbi:MAG TPA: DUF1707 domain-containing protein [Pseudonocardia sp.]|nr:DUF1707 domain-containing protein [Pseudonocardia sp.]
MSEPERPPMRVGHAERAAAMRVLGEHLAAGRLEPREYEERAGRAAAARTEHELRMLFVDLPGPAVPRRPDPAAPYGRDAATGLPYSDRSQVVAGRLQLLLPFGAGRFYTGHTAMAVAQLVLAFVGIGIVWAIVDGIVLLAGHPTDPYGRPLRT